MTVVGHLTALVGTSSAGKSSVAKELQLLLPEPHLVVGLDHFFSMFPHHWAEHPRGPGPGFWYEDSADADGRLMAQIRYGDAGQRLLVGMRAAVRALLDCGNNVILDEMPIDNTILPAWRPELAAYRVFWVLLTAPLQIVEARETQRHQGQHLGNARGHFDIAAAEHLDLHIDTSSTGPHQAAADIAAARPF